MQLHSVTLLFRPIVTDAALTHDMLATLVTSAVQHLREMGLSISLRERPQPAIDQASLSVRATLRGPLGWHAHERDMLAALGLHCIPIDHAD